MNGRARAFTGRHLAWGAVLVVVLMVFVLPVITVILSAAAARWQFPHLIPNAFSSRAVEFLWENRRGITRSLFSSAGYSLATVVLAFLVSVLPAEVLARYEFRGRIAVEALFLSPVLVPAITYGMGIHFLFIRLGVANTTLGVVLVLTAAAYPYMLRSLITGFQQIPADIDACAANLGASLSRRLLRLHIPLLGPAILAGGSVVFLVAFSEYFLVFLIGGGAVPSFTGYLFPFLSGGDRSLGSVLTLLFLVIPLLLFLGLDRTLTRYYRRRLMMQ
jgi:ABC-type spermidine/putrescine transport system permease subunit II